MPTRRKLVSTMLVLTVFGALLFLPPLIYVFNQDVSHFGVPQIVIYLFAVWFALIVATALLTRRLPRSKIAIEPGEDGRR